MNVKIIGIGGCGTGILEALINIGLDPENAFFMDTDINARSSIKSDNFVQLGKSVFKGLGTCNDPNKGRVAAEMTEGEIVEAMKGADTVILLAGLAGGAGAGAMPFIASLALDYIEAKTIAYVTLPAQIEGKGRRAKAEAALSNLRAVLDDENIYVIDTVHGTLATMFDNTDKLVAEKVKELLGDSFFQRRKIVFLGGSKSITKLTGKEKSVIDEYIAKDYQILVGDCRGADTEIQKHLVERGYTNVKVYATDGEARNNVGNFKAIDCPSMLTPEARARKDYFYYRIKDWRMLMLCDEILMFWDGISKASRENLEDGLRIKKPTKVVLRPFEVREIKIDEDIENIVGDIVLMNVLGVDGELLEDLRKYLSILEDSDEKITYDRISRWILENRK